ncbi:MAG: hypothetical protein ACI9VS_003214 [Candidatus Binatia bacterium]|jgi:hypothetical protein
MTESVFKDLPFEPASPTALPPRSTLFSLSPLIAIRTW